MELFKKTCKNPNCKKVFMGTRTQQYCCIDCRMPSIKPKPIIKKRTIDEIARKSKANGMSYGHYVAMQYLSERKSK